MSRKVRCYTCRMVIERNRTRWCCGYIYPPYPELLPEESAMPKSIIEQPISSKPIPEPVAIEVSTSDITLDVYEEPFEEPKIPLTRKLIVIDERVYEKPILDHRKKTVLSKEYRKEIHIRDQYTCNDCKIKKTTK